MSARRPRSNDGSKQGSAKLAQGIPGSGAPADHSRGAHVGAAASRGESWRSPMYARESACARGRTCAPGAIHDSFDPHKAWLEAAVTQSCVGAGLQFLHSTSNYCICPCFVLRTSLSSCSIFCGLCGFFIGLPTTACASTLALSNLLTCAPGRPVTSQMFSSGAELMRRPGRVSTPAL